ncbi:MAG: hypothetical protein HIU91_16395 [Acidobacteria bacterium]|nr:hypothetical protein [Acidobacteriota bacterium]
MGNNPWGFTPARYLDAPLALIFVMSFTLLSGCNSTPIHTTSNITTAQPTTQYPPRPTTPPPPFHLFHATNGSFTLVTTPTATDTQIAAIIYQLRDAAHTHTFDTLHIPQKAVDARDPMVWFHIYRGPKCAPEKYTDGKLPCGASYHAAGDYTFGGGTHHDWDDGVLLQPTPSNPDHQTELWNPNAPYTR